MTEELAEVIAGLLLNITSVNIGRFCMADGRTLESPIGIVNSIALDWITPTPP